MPLPPFPPFPQPLVPPSRHRAPFPPNNEPLPSIGDTMDLHDEHNVRLAPMVPLLPNPENMRPHPIAPVHPQLPSIGEMRFHDGDSVHLAPILPVLPNPENMRFHPVAPVPPLSAIGLDIHFHDGNMRLHGGDSVHLAPIMPIPPNPENMRSHPIAPVPQRPPIIQHARPPGGHNPQALRTLLPKPDSSHNTPGVPTGGTEHIAPGIPQKGPVYRITVLHVNLKNWDLKKVAEMDFTKFPTIGHFTRQRVGNTLSGVFGSIGPHSTDYTNDECNDSADDTGTTIFVIQGGACDGDWPCIAWRQVNGDQHEFSVYKIDPEKTPPGRFPNIPRQRDGQPSKRPKNPPDPELDEDFWKIFPQKAFEAAWAGLKKAIEDYKQRG
ncbi:hypothetical protein BDP27DRAFT_1362040 [Rhodocollybia butyracea]|uniref:Uncharacterized protein n=1 Tax=Rhodocollybia butyracea TaxID=206335 RepID=A0A9P5PXW8_9AGAR|nr:hypothetical protein BDP27DRAFT_1362040 [Rhodocollybia butyracea]